MAHFHFSFDGRFSEGAPERLIEKYRIVPESVGSFWHIRDTAFHFSAKGVQQTAGLGQRDHADESGAAIENAVHAIEQETDVLFAGGMGACKSRRINARRAAESIRRES